MCLKLDLYCTHELEPLRSKVNLRHVNHTTAEAIMRKNKVNLIENRADEFQLLEKI